MKRFTAAVMAVTLVFAAGAALPYTDKTGIAITASAAEMRTGKCGEGLSWYITGSGTLNISGFGDMTEWSESVTSPWVGDTTIKKVVISSNVKTIGPHSFEGCTGIEEVEFADTLTGIGANAFSGCTSLKNIEMPDSITELGWSAFENCSSAESLHIPAGITLIDMGTFKGMTSLESVEIPDTVENIEADAFSGCTALKEISIPVSVKYITKYALNDTQWLEDMQEKDPLVIVNDMLIDGEKCEGEVIIPDGVRYIMQGAFASNKNITSVAMPDSVTDVSEDAFYGCSGLEKAALSNDLKKLESYVFRDCSSLKSIELPDGIEVLENGCFLGCDSLMSVTVPKSVTAINEKALGFVYDYDTSDDEVRLEGFTIKGYKETAAEKYAKDNGFDFVDLEEEKPEPKFAAGDVNADKKIDIEDAVLVINHINGARALTGEEYDRSDIDRNEKTDIEDAVAIISHVNGVNVIE